MKAEILVVDDEPQIRKLLRVALTSYGYVIIPVDNGQAALASAERQKPDMIVLDINLGSEPDGLSVCRELRKWSTTPIIMISVNRDKQTRLDALNAGADDFMTKPFDMEELEARIRAILRRRPLERLSAVNETIRFHDLEIDLVHNQVLLKGSEIHLSPTEYKLLIVLAANPGKILTFRTLALEMKGESYNPRSHYYVHMYINKLRKRLQDDSVNVTTPRYIFYEPEIGYRFADLLTIEDETL
ncbi:MAG: response regulator transcription factor [Chloroflexota bacterium]